MERPDVQIAFTHFSPSAEKFAAQIGADFYGYLPFDTIKNARMALDALRPNLIVFSKLDVWPKLTQQAKKRGVKLALTSATLSPNSTRDTFIGRLLLGSAYKKLDVVGAIDSADAERLVRLGVPQQNMHVTGDLRYDQVWERAQKAGSSPIVGALKNERPTVVAGSTWPSDEKPLLNAWIKLKAVLPEARIIIAPHELEEKHLGSLESWARSNNLTHSRFREVDAQNADVVIVDGYGVLADLYALADVAYVGGGFHRAGLHSLVEPAAFGVPILFGPRFEASRDAVLMKNEGGGMVCRDEQDFFLTLNELLSDSEKHNKAGSAIRMAFLKELGAAKRSYELISALV